MTKYMTAGDLIGTPKTVTCKLEIKVVGLPTEFKVRPHKSNPDMMVLKTCKCKAHQHALAAFCAAAGIAVNNAWEGANYCIVEVLKTELLQGFANVINGQVTVKAAYLPPEILPAIMGILKAPDEEFPN